MKEPFVHLHVHSHYSMMRGVSSPETLCQTAFEHGFDSMALTDTNGFYGFINFLNAARKHHIRPIAGVHLLTRMHSAVFLATSPRGYEILSDLISRRHLDKNFMLPGNVPEAWNDLICLATDPQLLKELRARVRCGVEVVPGQAGHTALLAARALGLPPVATNAVYFAKPDDHSLHRLVRAIDCNRTMSTIPPEELVDPGQWLKSAEDMQGHLPQCPEAIANSLEFAKSCHTDWGDFRLVFPHYDDRVGDHFDLLREKCLKGIRWRYGQTNPEIDTRLRDELEIIRTMGFVDYFLVVRDIVSRRPIHCGRGSGAASLVSYLLGITHVEPIRHNLLFSRFLNIHRKDPPDIDVDFPWDERDDLFEEVRSHYGEERLAQVCCHVGFRARAAVREIAKVYGIPAADIREVTRRMGMWSDADEIQERVDAHPGFQGVALDPPWPEIIRLASRLESIPRLVSTHCGGVIIVPDRISRYVPVQKNPKGCRIIQWEKDQAEEAGLVKIDLLGNRSLAVIRDTLKAVAENTGRDIDYARLNPIDEPSAQELLRRGDTMGVFYVESPAMRLLQQKSGKGDFEHLVIHSSIIRPAANRYIQEYLRRLHGEPWQPLHPCLKELLSESYGILVYQEDVIQVAMAMAGFSWHEADGLRKVMSKKSPQQLSDYLRKFLEGCDGRGISRETSKAIWGMFISFAGYSFCKPHSASYALVSFKSAWLKVQFPAEFMAAVISNGGGYYSTFAYISESRRMGLTVLGPDVTESEWNYSGKGKFIRVGFQQLQGITKNSIETILGSRKKGGGFVSLQDFLTRVRLQSSDAAILVKSGALDSIAGSLNRPQLLWEVESWLNRFRPAFNASLQQSAFPRRRLPPPPLPDLNEKQKWKQEVETLGFMISDHPLAQCKRAIRDLRLKPVFASEIEKYVGQRISLLGWPITRKEVLTRTGQEMEFVSFEDQTSLYEAVFFPGPFRRFCQELDMNRPYLVYGKVESEFDTPSLTVERISKLPILETESKTPSRHVEKMPWIGYDAF